MKIFGVTRAALTADSVAQQPATDATVAAEYFLRVSRYPNLILLFLRRGE